MRTRVGTNKRVRALLPDRKLSRRDAIFRAGKYFAVLIAVLLVVAGIGSAFLYQHYSSLVTQRVESGFWHSRGGVYAAPRRFRVGDRMSREGVIDALKRAGYVEDESPDGIFNGSFSADGNSIQIQSAPRS